MTTPTPDRRPPRRAPARLADLVCIVVPPNNPSATQAFTAEEQELAEQYAAEHHATVQHFPTGQE